MKTLVLLISIALIPCAAAQEVVPAPPDSEPLPEVAGSPIGYESPSAALEALRRKPGAKIHEERGWTIVEDQESEKVFALWSFAPQGHPAYPAAIKRITFEKDGGIYLTMDVLCGGSKAACDSLVREFAELNERVRADMRPKQP